MDKIVFAIHDFNQRGGQDRSTLEIVQHLGERRKLELHAFTFEADRDLENINFRAVVPGIQRPALLKILLYHFVTAARFLWLRRASTPICATGACSLVSDIIHVQFVHASWRRREERTSLYGKVVGLYNLLSEKITFSNKKTYIAISNAVKADLEREYGLKKIAVVHHGVDSKKFKPCTDEANKRELQKALGFVEGSHTQLLFVGSFERKGLAVVLRALALLPKEISTKLRLMAVGSGNQEYFATLARELGIAPLVTLLPPKRNIEEYFRAADIFVFPTTYEPFGLVVLEAMASGLPCIVSRCAGAAELVGHGESGLLLEDPRNAEELSARIREIVGDASARTKMGALARMAAENRGWAQVAREYENVVSKWYEN